MLRLGLALCVALVPTNVIRVALLRWFFGYSLRGSKVGWGTVILADRVELDGARIGIANWIQCGTFRMGSKASIGRFNAFRMLSHFEMGNRSIVRAKNRFFGTLPGISPYKDQEIVVIGRDSIITTHHSFDVADEISIGDDVTFAGSGTQVWTHGFDLDHVKIQSPVHIGSRCYIGSRAMILAGASICDEVAIGAGCIVSAPIREAGFYVSSCMIRKGRVVSYAADERVVWHAGGRFVRK